VTASRGPNAPSGWKTPLTALLDGRQVGWVCQSKTGTLRFAYDDNWRNDPEGYAISRSMPLTAEEHKNETISAFLWGLLPDNHTTLRHYGQLFGVSVTDPVALLAHIGADCAGAIQFATPDSIDALPSARREQPQIDWLSLDEVATELQTVARQGIPGTDRRTAGQFSLAGAQPKIALLEEDGRWGRPRGRTPTNVILKPPSPRFPGFAENEHFCLELAMRLKLGSVRSRVLRFADQVAIVVDRFDRQRLDGAYRRIHQEDMCQALAVMPTQKYENEGGPGVGEIISIIREVSQAATDDVHRFIGALAFGWVIAATDGHAKNYALLHGPRGATRLAPFYDIASYHPYAPTQLHHIKVAMKIGTKYLVRQINRSSWTSLAATNGLPKEDVLGLVDEILQALPAAANEVAARAIGEGLDPDTISQLTTQVRRRVDECKALLASANG
jgi:serine/threonine-protein kinase HipA